MSMVVVSAGELLNRPSSVARQEGNLDHLVISASKQKDGTYIVVSRYGDDRWQLVGGATNAIASSKTIKFDRVPACFKAETKAMLYRYIFKGREGLGKPSILTVQQTFNSIVTFLTWLAKRSVTTLSAITPLHCINYAQDCKAYRKSNGEGLSVGMVKHRLIAVEAVHELSQFTQSRMPHHPWPESSSWIISGSHNETIKGKTPVIPEIFLAHLFKRSWEIIERGQFLLTLRDNKDNLKTLGWHEGRRKLNEALTDLRTACYIVLATTSGCRNHELAYLKNNPAHPDPAQRHPWYSTEDDEGVRYWWMRSRSDKTGAGNTEWMIPEPAVEALKIMEQWAAPYQAIIEEEIQQRKHDNPHDPEIIKARRHRNALFLGTTKHTGLTRTVSNLTWNQTLTKFARKLGLDMKLNSHMFRKTFAAYAAKSPYGDLVYLRDHFKHWTLDMTALYALNEHQDIDLYDEVLSAKEGIKIGIVEHWLDEETLLTGGAAEKIKRYRASTQELKVFETRKQMAEAISDQVHIRGAGHVWCINDTAGCKGHGFVDRTRCADCDNSVIDDTKKAVWQGIYEQQLELIHIDDIGQGAKERVQRDLARAKTVLNELGADIE